MLNRIVSSMVVLYEFFNADFVYVVGCLARIGTRWSSLTKTLQRISCTTYIFNKETWQSKLKHKVFLVNPAARYWPGWWIFKSWMCKWKKEWSVKTILCNYNCYLYVTGVSMYSILWLNISHFKKFDQQSMILLSVVKMYIFQLTLNCCMLYILFCM